MEELLGQFGSWLQYTGITVELFLREFWQWAVFAVLVVIGFIANCFDKPGEIRINFVYAQMPSMKPIRIETKDKGFFKAIFHWLFGVRKWQLTENFRFKIGTNEYVIAKGFIFDGASVPKFLAMWLSPVGVLLMGGLVHDYMYKFEGLRRKNTDFEYVTQKQADKIFRDICIAVNGFKLLNYLAYWALRVAGWYAWNQHRKNELK